MKTIDLPHGLYTIVDDEWFDDLIQHHWGVLHPDRPAETYARCSVEIDGNRLMHRIIMRATAGQIVDHINGRTLDNRAKNLRLVTRSENKLNVRYPPRSGTGYWGVTLHRKTGRFQSQIKVNGKNVYLGLHANPYDAALAYDAAAKSRGLLCPLNFPSRIVAVEAIPSPSTQRTSHVYR